VSLPLSKLDCKTYVTSILVDSITKNLSNHYELFYFYPPSSFDIYFNDDLSSHNEGKDEDQNTNSPCDQLDDNVST